MNGPLRGVGGEGLVFSRVVSEWEYQTANLSWSERIKRKKESNLRGSMAEDNANPRILKPLQIHTGCSRSEGCSLDQGTAPEYSRMLFARDMQPGSNRKKRPSEWKNLAVQLGSFCGSLATPAGRSDLWSSPFHISRANQWSIFDPGPGPEIPSNLLLVLPPT